MSVLLPYTVHFLSGQPLENPMRVYIECESIQGMYHDVIRVYPDVNPSFVETVCVKVVEDGAPLPLVVDTGLCDVPVFVVVHNNELLANKYFTKKLFTDYMAFNCCHCDTGCDDTCFLLMNGCVATVNGEGLLI